MVKLDIARNRILTAGLIFSMGSTCFTLGTLISGLFGTNVWRFLFHWLCLVYYFYVMYRVGVCVSVIGCFASHE